MSRYWSDIVNTLTPYVPGEQPRLPGLVKLNTNECPYPPSPRVLEAIRSVGANTLRLYPDPESVALRETIARRNGLLPEQVFVGNGSDEVLGLAFMALFKHERPLYFPDISYSFYPVWADLFGIAHVAVPVAGDLSIDPLSYSERNGGIVIPNPNAPTGVLMGLEAIDSLLRRSEGSAVIIDEAYIDFGGQSATSLIDRHENLLVVQTVSKSRALAGLRVGFAMGNAALIEGLQRVKNSFNSYPLDVLAQQAALAAFEDEAYFQAVCQRVIRSREHLGAALETLGFTVLPSAANFLFVSHARYAARDLFSELRARGIVVRFFDRPRIDNYLRISIGNEEDNAALLAALRDLLG